MRLTGIVGRGLAARRLTLARSPSRERLSENLGVRGIWGVGSERYDRIRKEYKRTHAPIYRLKPSEVCHVSNLLSP